MVLGLNMGYYTISLDAKIKYVTTIVTESVGFWCNCIPMVM